jgi:hypothetical protein
MHCWWIILVSDAMVLSRVAMDERLPTPDDAPTTMKSLNDLKGMSVGFDAGIPLSFLDAVYLKR